jgi:membrane protein YqaA with SNARE-associated domain
VDYLQSTAAHAHRHRLPIPHWLIHFGVLGVFAVSVVDASVIPLPLPGSTDLLVLLLATQHSALWLLILAAVSGSVLGGYLTWSAGKRGGEARLQRYVPKRFLTPLSGWVKRHGITSVCTASILPPPIPLMPFLLAAGALGVSRRQFLWAFTAARTLWLDCVAGSYLWKNCAALVVALLGRMVKHHSMGVHRSVDCRNCLRNMEVQARSTRRPRCWFQRACAYLNQISQRSSDAPEVKPAPTLAMSTRSFFFRRPSSRAVCMARGIVAAVVFP